MDGNNALYVEKLVGSTKFYKCEACPFMALAEGDIKYHLFTLHYELSKANGLADNVTINCPGCTEVFENESTLRTHLRNYHKMGLKDIKKMMKSLILVALTKSKEERKPFQVEVELTQSKSETKLFDSAQATVQIEIPPPEKAITKHCNEIKMSCVNIEKLQQPSPSSSKIEETKVIQQSVLNNAQPDIIASVHKPLLHLPNISDKPIVSCDTSNSCIKNEMNELNTKNTVKKPLNCLVPNCKASFFDLDKYDYHKSCHKNTSLQCPECNLIFSYTEHLHTHLWKQHSVDMELYACDKCDYKTVSRTRLKNIHSRIHKPNKDYKCNVCQKKYKNSNQLANHRIATHKLKKTVTCPVCDRELQQRSLKHHITVFHENIKPFVCSYCGYAVARKGELKIHIRSHTGEKVYSCDTCQYRSADHNAMRRHKKIHTRETMYKCKHCTYTCIQSTRFKVHLQNAHPDLESEEIYSCPHCNYKFIDKKKFISHLSKHSDKTDIQTFMELVNMRIEYKDDSSNDTKLKQDISTEIDTSNNKVIQTTNINENTNVDVPVVEMPADLSIDNSNKTDYERNCIQLLKGDNHTNEYNSLNVRILQSFLNPPTSMNSNILRGTLNVNPSSISLVNPTQLITSTATPPSISPVLQHTTNQQNKIFSIGEKIQLSVKPLGIGPIIKPSQILPVPTVCKSPQNLSTTDENVKRKKPKISVKSNLILKGPDEVNTFHSQQKMAFKQLEDSEHITLNNRVTFNNLISTLNMQLTPEPVITNDENERLNPMLPFVSHSSDVEGQTTLSENQNLFTFNRNVSSINIISHPQTVMTSNSGFIKLENKQNLQSPRFDTICRDNNPTTRLLNDYCKTSPSLEELNKNINEIKNELKSDNFYNLSLTNSSTSLLLDPCISDNVINTNDYVNHSHELPVVLPELNENDEQLDVIEIDDNSEDNKMLQRYDVNMPIDAYFTIPSDYHFLDNDLNLACNNITMLTESLNDNINRIVTADMPNMTQSKDDYHEESNSNVTSLPIFLNNKKDPNMNVTRTSNKINVKNIELMKNTDPTMTNILYLE